MGELFVVAGARTDLLPQGELWIPLVLNGEYRQQNKYMRNDRMTYRANPLKEQAHWEQWNVVAP